MDSYHVFTHILKGYFTDTGTIRPCWLSANKVTLMHMGKTTCTSLKRKTHVPITHLDRRQYVWK